ncbi:MAG: alcohol dehydrogenase catalytic domain-containing protein [Planctomycetaceae bacterium]|nr:alcohol dehydrogenase catalytic domain-containing protein [Planctomycetaceae bacterium]
MRAAVLTDSGFSLRADAPLPEVGEGDVRVRVLRAGICETDLQLIRGYMGFRGILGHEFVGVAETGGFAGQRVVGEINCSCHACAACRSGLANHCPHRTVLGILGRDGAFADYVSLPERNLHPVPVEVTDEQAVFVEPLAAAFQIPAQIPDLAGRRVLVLGDGRLGQLCAQVLQLAQTRLTVIGKHPHKLAILAGQGIDAGLRGEVLPDRAADVVVDCTGTPSGITDAFLWLRPRGTLVLKTTVAGTPEVSWAPIVIDELQVIGSRCGPFAPALAALAAGTVNVAPLISARFPLEEVDRAFEHVRGSGALKVLLDVSA